MTDYECLQDPACRGWWPLPFTHSKRCKDANRAGAVPETRTYGGSGTIHQTGEVNVETDTSGRVVAVWFRCQPLRWDQTVVDASRANEMRQMYTKEMPAIEAVVLRESE